MKTKLYLIAALSILPVAGWADGIEEGDHADDGDVEVFALADQAVCITSGTLSVRNDALSRVLFSAKRGDAVKTFQGWGDVKKTKVIGGKRYTFTKLQFPAQSGTNIGWVAENYIKERSACPGLVPPVTPPKPDPISPITGINDPRCCLFPLKNKPIVNYQSGVASFGAGRSRGTRKHAAADLYRNKGDSIFSIAHGTVIRNLYYFYQGTYALEVKHSGGFVVRYGEVGGRAATRLNQKLNPGDTVGYMGKTTCCKPMLHFELYSGAKTGSLSGGGVYQRRGDLMNPTSYLRKWQDKAFSTVE